MTPLTDMQMTKPDSSPEEIAAAGETALLIVYNGKTESLDGL